MSDEGRLVAGRYRIERRIGTGAMGAVWQAHDELLGRTVAVKQLLLQPGLEDDEAEEARQRTLREGRIAARLHHQHAISVFDCVTDEYAQPCLVMEYLESTSLAAVLKEHGTLDPIQVARIGEQVADALTSAHRVGIVHRDVKPANILIASDGTVKITDFGISRAKDDVSITKTGMIAGTPAYLAPEVAIGREPGPESDVFSLGSTLYAATEGKPPFGLSENTLGLLHAVAAGHINPPLQSGPLTSVYAVMLHPDKEQRPSAEETRELLAAVARGETPLGVPVTVGGAEGPESHGHHGTLITSPVAGYAGGGAGPAAPEPDDAFDDYADEEEDGRRRRGWLVAAGAALLVVGGLAAAGIWLQAGDAQEQGGNTPPVTTSETTKKRPQATSPETYTSQSHAPVTTSHQPEPTTDTPTETTTTSAEETSEPTSTASETSEPPSTTSETTAPTDPSTSETSVTTATNQTGSS